MYKPIALTAVALLGLWGCGYVGPVVPPSPEVPNRIIDLAVNQVGDVINIRFTTPPRTTDNLAIRRFSEIELQVGSPGETSPAPSWADNAKSYPLPLPPPNEPDLARAVGMVYRLPVSAWQGKTIVVAVRTAVKKTGHFSAWSNVVKFDVIPPLSAPEVSSEATPKGYQLRWAAVGPQIQYVITRQGATDTGPVIVATADQPGYLDTTAQWDTAYVYRVTAVKGAASSEPSLPLQVSHPDTFPPSVPNGLTALPVNNIVELSWERSPELDVKGYYVYRSVNGASEERQGELTQVPTFRDISVVAGKLYRYRVSAVDQKNNESDKSGPAEVTP